MIELQRSNDQIVRVIVKKFRSAIPERRLVLVAFQNELRSAPEPITLSEIFRNAANQEIWTPSRAVKNPRQHRRRRRLPVRAADDNRMPPRQKYFLQNFWQRAIRNLPVQHFFQLRIPARNDVSDDRQIRRRL